MSFRCHSVCRGVLLLSLSALFVGCDTTPVGDGTPSDAGVAIPDAALSLPDGGLSAADAGAALHPDESGLTLAEFRGTVDVSRGSMTIELLDADDAQSPSLRRMQQGLCALNIVQDGVPGSGPADSLELVTESTALDAACAGFAGSPLFCGNVTLRSFYASAKNDVYAQIQTLVPSTGYAVQNGDVIPGASSGLGSFSYGNLNGAPGPGNSATRPWVFARAGGNFTFQGRVVLNVTELCNGTDEDCDGLIDEGAGCFTAGTSCTVSADCASGLACNSGVCGAPGSAGSSCVTSTDCNSGLTCLASVCRSVTAPAAAGDVVVTEVMPRSISGTGDLGEWFEIHNPTSQYWDLSTCSFDDNNASNLISGLVLPPTGANSFVLPPGAYRVFAQSAVSAENHGLTPDFVYPAAIALSNTADLVRIKCGSTTIDEVVWTASSVGFVALGKSAQLDRSISSSVANDDLNNWCTPSTPTYSAGFSGTPGAQNGSCFVNQTIDRCRLDSPATISQIVSTTANVFGRVRIVGLTDLSDLVDLNGYVKMQAGYGATGTDASTWTTWSANGVASLGYGTSITTETGFDEYRATLTLPATVGNYDYAVRFTGDNGATWTYCDRNAGSGADGSENGYQAANAGALTARTPPNNPPAGGLVITELMVASQDGTPDDGEWIEVYNPSTTQTYDLDGCSISDGTSSVGITTTTTVAPGAYFVFGRSTDAAVNFGAPVNFAWGTAFQLNNSGESPTLTCGSTVVDTVVYPQLFEREHGASFQLHSGALDATSNDGATTNWCNSRVTYGAFGKKGSPGAANANCNLPIASCQLVLPASAQTGYAGATAQVAAVYSVDGLTGLTTGPDYATRVIGEVGIGPDGSNPTVNSTGWTFAAGASDATFTDAARDRSVATAIFPAVGNYDIAYRISGDGGTTWTYCDTTLNLTNADYAPADSIALTTTAPPGPPTAAGDIIFTEMMVSSGLGSTGTPAVDRGEWVEVQNTTANDLNLAGCTITDGEASTTISGSLVIRAGEYAIFGQDDSVTANGGMTGVALNYNDLLNLSNSGDNVELSCGTLVLDAFTYTSAFVTTGRSKQLAPDRFSASLNDNTGNWCGTTGAVFAGTRTGTPGAANTPCFRCRAQAPVTVTGVAGSTQSLTARIYIPGLTDAANVQSGPVVQFGTGPDATNPSTTDLAQWSFAPGSAAAGWDGSQESLYDEYAGSLTMPSTEEDWAARVSGDGGLSWTYCDRNVGAGADGSENGYQPANAGVVAPTPTYAVTDCQLVAPTTVTASGGTAAAVRATVTINGVTDATTGLNSNSSVQVQAAYGADGTLPSTWTGWVSATGDSTFSNAASDAYDASVTLGLTTGAFDFAFRVSGDAGTSWTYCDATGGVYAAADAGTLTVTPGTNQNYTVTDCSIAAPTSLTGTVSTTATVNGLVQITGLTDYSSGLNQAATVQVQVGGGADGSDPSTWTNWVNAAGDAAFLNATSDRYSATYTLPAAAGASDFAFRVSGDGGTSWTYCDTTGGAYSASDAGAVTANPNAFLAGNYLVEVIGDGAAALSGNAAAVSVREYASGTGSLMSSVTVPFTGANLLTDSGTATSNGYMNVFDGYTAVPGINAALATAGVAALNQKAVNILSPDRSLGSRVTFPTGGPAGTPVSPFSGNNFRSVVPLSATTFYAAGNSTGSPVTGGVWYYNGGSFVQVSSTVTGQPTNVRTVGVFGGQLFIASSTGTYLGISSLGSGLPSASAQSATLVINMGTGASPYGFAFADTNRDGALDRVYIADDRTTTAGGLYRYDLVSGVWTLRWNRLFGTAGALTTTSGTGVVGGRGLSLTYDAGTATVLVTTADATGNRVVRVTDASADGSTVPSTYATVATAGTNTIFRGVAIFNDCGDGRVDGGEICDDGNTVNNDSCSNSCLPSRCGDGIVQTGESCDDGNTVNTDSCTNVCAAARCGDGFVQGTEACDDGNSSNTDACTNACAAAACGDGFVQGTEACDDGNSSNTDACTNACAAAACGDGFVQGTEACDDGNSSNTDACTNVCAAAACGDGFVQGTEACDDGNTVDADACSNSCACGGGFHLELGVCLTDTKSCTVANGVGTQTWTGSGYGACTAVSCSTSFHVELGACASDTRACSTLPANTTAGTESWTGSAYGSCSATACASSFHVESGACVSDTQSCSITNGTGSQTWTGSGYGDCTAVACNSGFHVEGGACASDTRACSTLPANTTAGTESWTGSAYGSCSATACATSYHVESGACVSDTQSCSITNGTGNQTWTGSAYGTCTLATCNSGYHANGNACDADVISCSATDAAAATQTWTGSAYGTCTISACNTGFALVNNACVGGCGNGIVSGGETCDDGNTVTEKCSYGQVACTVCNSSCQSVAGDTDVCGDGILDTPEFCDDGNATDAGSCNAICAGCSTSFHAEGGDCTSDTRSCSISNGSGTETWTGSAYGLCTLTSCNSGYHANGNACDADVIACTTLPANTTAGTQTWTGSAYGSCVATTCGSGYHVETGACVNDTQSCAITNGTGFKVWSSASNDYGSCTLLSCNSGFHAAAGACDADVISCSLSNATAATQTWDGTAYGSCTATACATSFHVESGACASDTRSCSITNGTGTQSWTGSAYGSCTLVSCSSGYHANGNACDADVIACTTLPSNTTAGTQSWTGSAYDSCVATACSAAYHVESGACVSDTRSCSTLPANTTAGTQTWNGSAYGSCTATACASSYHIEFGACVSDTRSCTIANGTGSQTWNGSAYGVCTVVSCNSGFHAEGSACASDTRACATLPANAAAGTETWTGSAYGACVVSMCIPGYALAGGNCSTVANLIIQRNGVGGTTVLASSAQTVALVEVTQGGTAVGTTTLDNGTPGTNTLTDSGSAGSNGYLNTRGPWLSVGGYNAALGTTSVASTNTKVVHLYNATLSSFTRVLFPTDATVFAANNFRSSIPVSATQFYATGTGGTTGGVWYYTGAGFTQISTTVTNVRNVEIYGGNLYFSTGAGTSRGIYQVGSGLPTASNTTASPLLVTGTANPTSPVGFVLFDTNADTVMDLAYVCDDAAGLQKWVYASGAWGASAAWTLKIAAAGTTLSATGNACNGLTGSYAAGTATLYFTENITAGNNRIMKVVDSGTTPTAASVIATAGTNYAFRGVDFKGF